MNNAAHYAFQQYPVNVGSIVYSIYSYFSTYAVRTSELEQFCEFAEVEFKKLLMYSRTRWLSLYPAVERILSIYDGLKSYFLSQDPKHVPMDISNFFKDDLNEAFLWFVHSFMSDVHPKILLLELDDISILETYNIIKELEDCLLSKMNDEFLPLKVRSVCLVCEGS